MTADAHQLSSAKWRDTRRRAREAALQMLYQWEVGHLAPEQVLDSYWSLQQPGVEPTDAVRRSASHLMRGTIAGLQTIDPLIADVVEHWRPERLAVIDRLILRLGVHELLGGETPAAVVIDEAIELAKAFSGEDAARFINGVLDAIRRQLDERGKTPETESKG